MGNDVGESIWDSHPEAKKLEAAAKKANARGLKAANQPVSKGNRLSGPAVRDAILSAKPANPNVVRGGSMKSQLNWPESMKTKTSGLSGQGGVLGGQHAGGHSDVAGMSTTNIGGSILKTPVIKPGSIKNK